MCLGGAAEFGTRRLQHDATVEDVREQHQQGDEHQCRVEPTDRERDERQTEHVEADVFAELRIFDAERLAVTEQQPLLPLAGGRQREQQAEHCRRSETHQAQATTEEVMEPLDHRVHVGREGHRRQTVGDDEVHHGHGDEHRSEESEQERLAAEYTPEHVAPMDTEVPEVVDVETGEETCRQQQHEAQGYGADEDLATTIADTPLATGPTGKI